MPLLQGQREMVLRLGNRPLLKLFEGQAITTLLKTRLL